MKDQSSFPYNISFAKQTDKNTIQLIKTIEFNSKAYGNLKSEGYESEEWGLDFFNIKLKPALKGTRQFKDILNTKEDFKWVYTIYRELLIAPASINGHEISHALIAKNRLVFAAGCGEWNNNILEINNFTGHYEVKASSFRIHCQVAWYKAGVAYIPVEKDFQ